MLTLEVLGPERCCERKPFRAQPLCATPRHAWTVVSSTCAALDLACLSFRAPLRGPGQRRGQPHTGARLAPPSLSGSWGVRRCESPT